MASLPENVIYDGDPTADLRAFRNGLGQYATGVTVVTARHENQQAGLTANSFSSLSLNPPLVLWSIGRSSRSLPIFEAAEYFAVNILSSDQIDISQKFSSAVEDKFAGVTWKPGSFGSPILDGTVSLFECKRQVVHNGGDHLIIVGSVERCRVNRGSPLIFVQGRYVIAQEHPQNARQPSFVATGGPVTGTHPSLLTLLSWAQYRASLNFEKHRQAEGVSLIQSRIIYALYDQPGIALNALVKRTYLSKTAADDAIAELIERRLVVWQLSGTLALTEAGIEVRDRIYKRSASFHAETLAWAPTETVETVRNFLKDYSNHLDTSLEEAEV
jgi:4-hydroxyphenylacetate 3-hydroxylase, reductase component